MVLNFWTKFGRGEISLDGIQHVAGSPNFEVVDALMDEQIRTAKPALIATTTSANTRSHFGGLPELPSDVSWPIFENQPLVLLAQIDCSELPSMEGDIWLPSEGLLLFFAASDEAITAASDRAHSILYVPSQKLSPRADPDRAAHVIARRNIQFQAVMSYRPRTWIRGANLSCDDDEELFCRLTKLAAELPSGPRFQIGGWPSPIQDFDMVEVCEISAADLDPASGTFWEQRDRLLQKPRSEWQLLFQFDLAALQDRPVDGYERVYFWIRAEDARASDFTQTVLLGDN